MKEDMEDNGNEKTRMGKLKTKWKENGLDERCNQNRRERNRTGRREREKETHYLVTRAPKGVKCAKTECPAQAACVHACRAGAVPPVLSPH